jgi:hypothetical protein
MTGIMEATARDSKLPRALRHQPAAAADRSFGDFFHPCV